jgi:leucyl aminopeptidase
MLAIEWSAHAPPIAPGQLLVRVLGGTSGREDLDEDTNIEGLRAALEAARFRAKLGETFKLARTVDGVLQQVLVVGAGDAPHTPATARRVAYEAARAGATVGAQHVVVDLAGTFSEMTGETLGSLVATGFELGTYRYDRFVAENERGPRLFERITVVTQTSGAAEGSRRGSVVGRAVNFARDLGNGPADLVTPSYLADQAQQLSDRLADAGHDVGCTILERDECARRNMGCFLGVARGSDTPPKFIHLTYRPKNESKGRVCLVGKGVTFDSGGYSLKPTEGMYGMKLDMGGAAAVLGSFAGLAELGVDYEVHAISAATENMVSGHAYRLGDVLTASDGTTVEVNNTDAEGRLTLADALVYARGLDPDCIIDFATLTGACVVALGPHIGGVMSRTEGLTQRWMEAAQETGEEMWRLPLPKPLLEMLESKIADLRNTGERWGGALTAGLFLEHFVGEVPWVHVDIAGPGMCEKPFDVNIEGGTGFGVATTLALLSGSLEPAS